MTDADQLASVALRLACRVRDEAPTDNATWLARQLPDPNDWFRLAFALAAAVPIDKPWRQLTAWTVAVPAPAPKPQRGRPAGIRTRQRAVKPVRHAGSSPPSPLPQRARLRALHRSRTRVRPQPPPQPREDRMIRIPAGTDLDAVLNDLLTLTGTRPSELARLTGFAEGQISKWRRGMVVPSAPVLLRLFSALGYDLALVPLIHDGPSAGLSAPVADQEAETHTRVGVDHANGSTGPSGGSRLGHLPHCDGFFGGRCEPDCPMRHRHLEEQP